MFLRRIAHTHEAYTATLAVGNSGTIARGKIPAAIVAHTLGIPMDDLPDCIMIDTERSTKC